jgi:hypothetical protein
MPIDRTYLETLSARRKDARAYHKHQALGAELGELLRDTAHTALYIKLALQFDETRLRTLAKTVAEKRDVKNKGAYFMRVLYSETGKPKR